MMNQKQRDTLATALTDVFGRIDDRFIDAAVQLMGWIELQGGQTLISQGDPPSGLYFVISGRLRAVAIDEDEQQTVSEIGRGETIGETSVLTGDRAGATVVAVRDTVLAHVTSDALDLLLQRYPQFSVHMARVITKRMKRSSSRPPIRKPSTICLLSITDGVDLRALAEDLVRELDRWGVATLESSDRIDARFGDGAAESTDRDSDIHHRVTTWLDDVEFWNEFTILLADPGDTEWTRRCLRHADEVLLVARADAPVAIHPIEDALCAGERAITGAHQTLLLLHDESRLHPNGTEKWLDRRPIDLHLHVRPKLKRDITRLARIVSGNAIGLVFAGGGARGFAHLGVYKALQEAGVEIDFVGGTSMGGTMAAYVALDRPADMLIRLARKTFKGNPTGDFNILPLISLIKGGRVRAATEQAIIEATGSLETDVADSWLSSFCIASNYSTAREMVITRGRLDRAIRATLSIPVALPPVLWNGELLIDGAVFNNFPTDVMARFGAKRIIGVDVGGRPVRKFDFEDIPSTWQLLRDRLRGRKRRRYRLPGLGALLMGTTILYSDSRREQARRTVDIFLKPEVSRISFLDWKSYDRLVEIGYRDTKEALAQMSDEELAPYRNLAQAEEPVAAYA